MSIALFHRSVGLFHKSVTFMSNVNRWTLLESIAVGESNVINSILFTGRV